MGLLLYRLRHLTYLWPLFLDKVNDGVTDISLDHYLILACD